MATLQVVKEDQVAVAPAVPRPTITPLVVQWSVGILVVFSLGTWLVWWAAYSQRQFVLEEIRTACHRVMPETVERCVDTVVIQRGGARR
jgi:hypothetical protein